MEWIIIGVLIGFGLILAPFIFALALRAAVVLVPLAIYAVFAGLVMLGVKNGIDPGVPAMQGLLVLLIAAPIILLVVIVAGSSGTTSETKFALVFWGAVFALIFAWPAISPAFAAIPVDARGPLLLGVLALVAVAVLYLAGRGKRVREREQRR